MKMLEVRGSKRMKDLLSIFVNPNAPIDTYTRSLVLVFLCFLMGIAKFISLLQVILSTQSPSFLTFGIFGFWMQMMCIPFFVKRAKNLYFLSHYTLAMLYVGVLYSTYAGCGYVIVNCTVFPILPLFATFLFESFWDSFAWCIVLLLTNAAFFTFKADWEPGNFPTVAQLSSFTFFANMMSMAISAALGGVFNFSSSLKQKELERERDKAQELSKIKSEFTANVSHEIRTPLVAVIGLSELLAKDTLLTSDQRYLINTIYSASLHLDNLVNNVLNFSKTEANMTQLDSTTFDVSELVEETLLYFSAMAESCGIRLLSFIDPISTDGLCSVLGDPHRIQQILQNLVANAIKFCAESPQGEVLITLDTIPSKTRDFNGRWYRFSVADNGIGMSKAGLQRLFQPFSQCDNSTTRRYGGTGLGLVICKQLCTLLGGDIEVDSEEGKGTTITFTLPLDLADTPENDAQAYPSQMRKRETVAAAEAAAHAAASAADAAEEAELEAGHAAAKAAAESGNMTPQEKRAALTTASAAKQTAHAAKATADAARTTAEAAQATHELFDVEDKPGVPFPTTKLPDLSPPTDSSKILNRSPSPTTKQPQLTPSPPPSKKVPSLQIQTTFSQKSPRNKSPFNPSPLRQPMQLTKPKEEEGLLRVEEIIKEGIERTMEKQMRIEDIMNSLELDPESRIYTNQQLAESEEIESAEENEEYEQYAGKEPLMSPSEENLVEKARTLSTLAKDFVANASGWQLPGGKRQLEEPEGSSPESPFSRQMRTTLDDIQQILRQTERDKLLEMRKRRSTDRGVSNEQQVLPPLVRTGSVPSPDLLNLQRELPVSPQIEGTRHGRSKSMTGLSAPFSPSYRHFLPQDPNFSAPPTPSFTRMKSEKKVGGGMVAERTPMFSPDFQKILAKSQEFWTSTGSLSSELRRGATGYLDPISDTRQAWAQIREGMRSSAASASGDAICVLAGSQGAREVIKSSLLFRGLTNTEVMDGEAYAKILCLPRPPHFRVVIAEADLFAHMSAEDFRGSDRSDTGEGLAEVLNPAIFDPRVSTRYILLISCKYHRFGKFIQFAVPPVDGGSGEDTVKVVFCANNPVRRSSLAQSLLACVKATADERVVEGKNQPTDSPSPPQTSRSNLRILLCEDNLVNIEVLTRQLKKLGYTNCDIKNNGADGVEAFKQKVYDIVLMDCQMPVLDGYEATKEIRRLEQERKAKKRVPIVALTASAMPEERERGMKSGMDNYLSKPIQLAVLQNILESVQATS